MVSSILSLTARFVLWAGLAALMALALVRLGFWATGSATLHSDLQGPPQIFEWHMDHPDFGGLSALIVAPDGGSLIAGGDRGALIEATLTRGAADDLTDVTPATLTKALLRTGHAPTDFKMDLEAMTPAPDGGWLIAYESYVRIEHLSDIAARPQATHYWDEFVDLFGNQAFEALATLPDGRVIAITEDSAPASSVIWDGDTWARGPAIPVTPDYRITGADVGPDGCLYLIERHYGLAAGFRFGLRRLSGGPDAWEDTLIYRAAPARLGNAEGLSVWQDSTGQMRVSIVTDDGFLPLTATRLIEFRMRPGVGCAVGF